MRKLTILSLLFLLLCGTSFIHAIPAKPGLRKYCQPDGTEITVRVKGDESFHFYETADGLLLKAADNGALHYAVLDQLGKAIPGKYIASDKENRTADENNYILGIKTHDLKEAFLKENVLSATTRSNMPGAINISFPTVGKVKGIVILAEYQDVKFCSDYETLDVYKEMINAENYSGEYSTGSVRDYYVDQSGGKFIPEFDVVGPVTLPQNRKFYGTSTAQGENVSQMIIDACLLAHSEWGVDFSQYDMNNDGTVDFIYVIYAGHGEAQGGVAETVWPQSASLEYVYFKKLSGKYLGNYACSCELSGGSGTKLDGIGTFCHEYGHILGLPDLYDTTYSGFYGMGRWALMDVGSYNNGSRTPPALGAMERYTLGWLQPDVLDVAGSHSLTSIEESNKAYFMVSDHDENEYFVMENRQPVKWDASLPGHGLLISQIHYKPAIWGSNRVNTTTAVYEHVRLIAADNSKELEDEDGDTFPGSTNNMSFTDFSLPAALWNNGERVKRPILQIKEGNDGVITFDYMLSTGIQSPAGTIASVEITVVGNVLQIQNPSLHSISLYDLNGFQIESAKTDRVVEYSLPQGVYIVRIDTGESFKIYIS